MSIWGATSSAQAKPVQQSVPSATQAKQQERTWAGFAWQTGEVALDLGLKVGCLVGSAFLLSYGCNQIQSANLGESATKWIPEAVSNGAKYVASFVPDSITKVGTSVINLMPSLETIGQLGFGVAAAASIAQAAPVINPVVDSVLDPTVAQVKGTAQGTAKATASVFYTYVAKPSYEHVGKPMYNWGAGIIGAKKI